jgi:hypothetical protein
MNDQRPETDQESRRQNIVAALDLGLIAHHTAAELLLRERKAAAEQSCTSKDSETLQP